MTRPLRAPRRGFARPAHGFTILESLVALLIFSFGVLALVGLQAASIQQTTNAKYRSEANLLADELIGEMWASDRTVANLQAQFNTGGAFYNTWNERVQAALPGAAASAPTVVVDNDSRVTISVFWRPPNEPATQPHHRHTVVTQIR